MPKIIMLSGKAESGKDATADILKTMLANYGKRVKIIYFAESLKWMCATYLGWNGEKDEAGRTLLQETASKIRHNDAFFLIKVASVAIDLMQDEYDYFILPDWRFPSEFAFMQGRHPNAEFHSVRVTRMLHTNSLTPEQRSHDTETALDHFEFMHRVISPNGLFNLTVAVKPLCEFLLGEPQ